MLRAGIRIAILWVMSLVVAIAVMEGSHRFLGALDGDRPTAPAPQAAASFVGVAR
jgi:hypothetical protein